MEENKQIPNNTSYNEQLPLLKEFVSYIKSFLELESLPPLHISYDPMSATKMKSFGGYNPEAKNIKLNIYNRHQADIFRTLAHELVHYQQDIQNKLYPGAGDTGTSIENEANANAAVIMRNFAQQHPEMFKV